MGTCGRLPSSGSYDIAKRSDLFGVLSIGVPISYQSHRINQYSSALFWRAELGEIPARGHTVPRREGARWSWSHEARGKRYYIIRSRDPSPRQLISLGFLLIPYDGLDLRNPSGNVKIPFSVDGNTISIGRLEHNACTLDIHNEFTRAFVAYIEAHRAQSPPNPNNLQTITLYDAEFDLGDNQGFSNVNKPKPIRYTAAQNGMRGFSPPRDYDLWQLHASRGYTAWTLGFYPVPTSTPDQSHYTKTKANFDARFGSASPIAYPLPLANASQYVRGLTLFEFTYQNKQQSNITRLFNYVVDTTGIVPIIRLHTAGRIQGEVLNKLHPLGEELIKRLRSTGGEYKLPRQLVPTTGIPIDDRTTRKYGGQILPVGRPQTYQRKTYSVSQGGYLE